MTFLPWKECGGCGFVSIDPPGGLPLQATRVARRLMRATRVG